jgi:hypothetical protein
MWLSPERTVYEHGIQMYIDPILRGERPIAARSMFSMFVVFSYAYGHGTSGGAAIAPEDTHQSNDPQRPEHLKRISLCLLQ